MHTRHPALRRLTAVATTAVFSTLAAMAASGVSTVSAAPSATQAAPPACASSGLVTWIDTNGNGAAGTIFYRLQFTNLSGHTCTLRGYPGVSGIDLHGHALGAPAIRQTGPVHRITLTNGATAKALLGIAESSFFPPATCQPATAAGLRVFAPNQSVAKTVPFPFGICTHGPSNLRIRPITH